jgi:hypothetical protein
MKLEQLSSFLYTLQLCFFGKTFFKITFTNKDYLFGKTSNQPFKIIISMKISEAFLQWKFSYKLIR